MSPRLKACWLVVILVVVVILTSGCASYQPMKKATSIEDYCKGVYAECKRYQEGKRQGADRMDVAFYIANLITKEKQAKPKNVESIDKEFERMKWAADQIFLGLTPLDVERECLTRRYDGSW